MEFALNAEQKMLQESLGASLREALPIDTIKAIAAGDAAARARVTSSLADFGLDGLLVPEADGGLGLGALEACLVQECLGYACAPGRTLSTLIASYALRGTGGGWLAGIADGSMRFGIGLTELSARRDGTGITEIAGVLSGRALGVLDAEGATHLLVSDAQRNLHVVEAGGASSMQTIDRVRHVSEVQLSTAKSLARVADGEKVLAFARLLVAADTLGTAQSMLDKAVAYASQRQQFGRVIGSFQAVKHMCAEMAARLEPSRALVWHAAHALDTGDAEGVVMAHLAKAHLADAGTFIARTSTEVHGGMGFTDLVGLHYSFKRIGLNRQLFGSPEAARESAARAQGLVLTNR